VARRRPHATCGADAEDYSQLCISVPGKTFFPRIPASPHPHITSVLLHMCSLSTGVRGFFCAAVQLVRTREVPNSGSTSDSSSRCLLPLLRLYFKNPPLPPLLYSSSSLSLQQLIVHNAFFLLLPLHFPRHWAGPRGPSTEQQRHNLDDHSRVRCTFCFVQKYRKHRRVCEDCRCWSCHCEPEYWQS
jgi:hypothetical protein